MGSNVELKPLSTREERERTMSEREKSGARREERERESVYESLHTREREERMSFVRYFISNRYTEAKHN